MGLRAPSAFWLWVGLICSICPCTCKALSRARTVSRLSASPEEREERDGGRGESVGTRVPSLSPTSSFPFTPPLLPSQTGACRVRVLPARGFTPRRHDLALQVCDVHGFYCGLSGPRPSGWAQPVHKPQQIKK